MSNFLRKAFVFLMARSVYVVLGAVIMLAISQVSVRIPNPDNEFIIPDLRQVEECVNYQFTEDMLIGQICHLDNGYTYLYLPDDQYSDHLQFACAMIMEKLLREQGIPNEHRENCYNGG